MSSDEPDENQVLSFRQSHDFDDEEDDVEETEEVCIFYINAHYIIVTQSFFSLQGDIGLGSDVSDGKRAYQPLLAQSEESTL